MVYMWILKCIQANNHNVMHKDLQSRCYVHFIMHLLVMTFLILFTTDYIWIKYNCLCVVQLTGWQITLNIVYFVCLFGCVILCCSMGFYIQNMEVLIQIRSSSLFFLSSSHGCRYRGIRMYNLDHESDWK